MKSVQKLFPGITKRTSTRLGIIAALSLSSVASALQFSCTTLPSEQRAEREVPEGPRVSIMTFNVENLFDTQHDEGKEDYTFLPLDQKKPGTRFHAKCLRQDSAYRIRECLETDWNEDILKEKIKRVANTIQQINKGRGPDIQILVEVENKNALERLRTEGLSGSDYQTSVLLEGPDERGIDTAVLSRLPQWDKPLIHIVPYIAEPGEKKKGIEKSRGILEVRLTLPDGQKLAVFSAHFPSQNNPTYLRKQAIEFLGQLQKKLPQDVIAVAGGDLNITRTEEKDKQYYAKIAANDWVISHFEGCKTCQGTYYYHPQKDWSFLDTLLFSKSMHPGPQGTASWRVDLGSVRLPADGRYQLNKFHSPAKFDEKSNLAESSRNSLPGVP